MPITMTDLWASFFHIYQVTIATALPVIIASVAVALAV